MFLSSRRLQKPSLIVLALVVAAVAGSAAAAIQAEPGIGGLPGPTGLKAQPTQTTILLTWNPVTGARSYETYLNQRGVGSTTQTSWLYTGLTCGTTYLLGVDARYLLGRSRLSSMTASTSACTPSGPPPPTVSSFAPTSGQVGASVTVTGSGFTGATAVTFGGTAATFTVSSDTKITTTVPGGAQSGPITVTGPGGTGTSSSSFSVTGTPPPAPTISSFSPTSGSVGSSVTVTGSGFTGATAVRFNGTTATYTVVNDTQITTTVPSAATNGPISVTTAAGTATSTTSFTVTSTPPPSGNANVFIAPPASAGLGTHGSDSDSTNCKRFASGASAPPSGVGYGCATFQQAYQLAKPGDTVYLNWSGAWSINQLRIGPSGNKSSSAGCLYPTDVSGCINFTPAPSLTPSLTPASSGSQAANLGICADYVELSNLTFNGFTYVDRYGDTLSDTTWGVGAGDNSCQPGGSPPHDIFINNVVSNGPIGIVGGAYNVYMLGGAIQNSMNFPPQFGGPALVNGVYSDTVHNSTMDGVLFNNIVGTDSAHHHMDCMHMDYSGYNNTVQNSRFESCPGSYEAIRVEAEGNPANNQDFQTGLLIQNNFFDGQPLGFDCHDNGCVVSGNIVRFNTLNGGGFLPTNDCAQTGGNTCTVANDLFYGNLVTNGCPGSGAISGLGWTAVYNGWSGSGGSGTICAADTTSRFNATITLVSPGAPNYNDKLANCQQTAANYYAPGSLAAGNPNVDIFGDARPKSNMLDLGADEAC